MKTRKMPFVFLLAVALMLTGLGISQAGNVPLMTADELKAMLGDPDLVVLDVRRGKDWKSSEFKIQSAAYAKPEAYDQWANTYSKSKKIVLYCA